jgi:F420H(2)-dependent quinone reductase
MAKHPDRLWIRIGRRRVKVVPEKLEGAERERAWKEITAPAPGYGRHQENADRIIPIIRLKAQEE